MIPPISDLLRAEIENSGEAQTFLRVYCAVFGLHCKFFSSIGLDLLRAESELVGGGRHCLYLYETLRLSGD